MNPNPSEVFDSADVPVLLQSAARNLRLSNQALAEASQFPKEAFASFIEMENLALLSECLMLHETLADRLRRLVTTCRTAYNTQER